MTHSFPTRRSSDLGSPTGGGNFYVFKDTTEEERAAALKLIQFMTSPEQAAAWSIATGYMGVSPAAYETEALKAYTEAFPPALVARNQLEHRSEEHTSELQSLMRISYAVFCLKKKKRNITHSTTNIYTTRRHIESHEISTDLTL